MRLDTLPLFKAKCCPLEVLDLVKVTTIADAMKCAAKINAGKACSAAEMRATIKLLDTGLKTSRRTIREMKRQITDKDSMVRRLLAKLGV